MKTMVGCNQTRRMIDEADHPESLPFDASSHVATCPDCGSFAEDRARLRSLMLSGTRVTVPVNFDAVLKSRLAEARARTGFAWLSPAGYLRLGGATAALVVMVFGAQYAGLFGTHEPTRELRAATVGESPAPDSKPVQSSSVQPAIISNGPVSRPATVISNSYQRVNRYPERTVSGGVPLEISREDYLHEDSGVMLVRGSNGEGEVSLPMVSVGAQSLVYASAGASRRPARTIGTSF
jgi:hypothetical protein